MAVARPRGVMGGNTLLRTVDHVNPLFHFRNMQYKKVLLTQRLLYYNMKLYSMSNVNKAQIIMIH